MIRSATAENSVDLGAVYDLISNTLALIGGWGMNLILTGHFSHKLEKIFGHSRQNFQFVAVVKRSPTN